MSKIFLTGASGLIGGQVLRELVRSHPEYAITALVRSVEARDRASAEFPKVRFVKGDLDDAPLVQLEASRASIILHLGANKHMPSMQAIQRGLQTRQSSGPVYWIQISGASALASFELANSDFVPGSPSSTVYDDISGIDDLNSLVRAFPSRAIDNFVLDLAANDPSIKTALIWPCVVYGTGEGFGKTWSTQIPTLCSLALEKGHAVRVGEGLNRWGTVHVRDLGMLVRLLAEAASARREDKDLWGSNGIYLTGVGETTFGDMVQRISRAAREQGFIDSDEIEALSKAEADRVIYGGTVFYGPNCRGSGCRGRKLLGWEPSHDSVGLEIPQAIAEEAMRKA